MDFPAGRVSCLSIADLRSFLAGRWIVARLILDHRTGERGSFVGWSQFRDSDEGLDYEERGCMLLGAYRGLATRRYRYGFPSSGCARVTFTDGRLFHELDLTEGRWRAEHLCGSDRYAGRFISLARNLWQAEWHVTGPRKDFRLIGLYTGCGASCGRPART